MRTRNAKKVGFFCFFFNLRVNMTRHAMLGAGLEFFFSMPKKELIIRA